MLELLAPAGDMEALNVAVASGADAVYLGLGSFNARMKANNFDEKNIAEAVAYAHFYGVKIYVTVNTVVQNEEIEELIRLVRIAVNAGADAFLVQDLGVARVLLQCFDGITLHASTQMGVHNLYGAKVAEKIGIKRVVLSRETKLEDIKAIKDNTSLEIEYFVQGALCTAFSGNCYLSALEQGASGNRGLCKQLCRLPYRAELAGERYDGYLLSARDLCLYPRLKELAEAGVTSFKIEGRLRRNGYVACAVQAYRKALDDVARGINPTLTKDIEDDLKTAFGRGEYLKNAYLEDGTPSVVEKRFNNHAGIKIGCVKSVKPFKEGLFETTIACKHSLNRGDGLKFFDNEKEVASLGVGDATPKGNGAYSFVTRTRLKAGWQVNLILDAEKEATLLSKKRCVPITVNVVANVGTPLEIEAIYASEDESIFVKKASEEALQAPKTAPTTKEEISVQCAKTADSGFVVESVSVSTDGVFIAKSVLNALRRDVLAELKERIISANTPKTAKFNEQAADKCVKLIGSCKICEVKKLKVLGRTSRIVEREDRLVLRPSVYGVEEIRRTLELFDLDEERVALELPVIANGKDLRVIEKILGELKGIRVLLSENIYGFYFADKGYEIVAGEGHNIANAFAALQAKELGASGFVPSLEYPNMRDNGEIERFEINERLPLMTLAHCPYKAIFGNDCKHCSYKPSLTISREKHYYDVRRVRVGQCYFGLFPKNEN